MAQAVAKFDGLPSREGLDVLVEPGLVPPTDAVQLLLVFNLKMLVQLMD